MENYLDHLWEDYEKALSHLRELEKRNKELRDMSQIDAMRINYLNNEIDAKKSDRDLCAKRLQNIKQLFSSLSEKLKKIEDLKEYQEIDNEQVEELNKLLTDVQNNMRDPSIKRIYYSTS